MTRDDIIRLAREASGEPDYDFPNISALERFAALVAAAEREECAEVCVDVWDSRTGLETGTALQCVDAIRARGESK